MGYLNNFEVRVYPARPAPSNVVRYFSATSSLQDVRAQVNARLHWSALAESNDGTCLYAHGTKWYREGQDGWPEVFAAVSRVFRDTVIEVTRFGEDDGDIERQFFHNGAIGGGKAEIVFPPNPFSEVTDGQ